jgi:hypothetical protein
MIVWLLPLVSVHAVLSGRGNCGGEEEELIMISKAECGNIESRNKVAEEKLA